ncbi:MAG: hypothetical protein IKW79_07445, partial [Schwartzia sp.]|nr:hypothetical protein [Schwartzia sp. (in: firmicutes)]
GISKEGEMVDMAVQMGIIQKSGAWFSYGEQRIGQGRDKVKQYFADNPDFAAEIEEKLRAAMTPAKKTEDPETAAEEAAANEPIAPNNGRLNKIKIDIAALHRDIIVTFDGQESFHLQPGDVVIVRRAEVPAKIVKFDDKPYYQTIRTKLLYNS